MFAVGVDVANGRSRVAVLDGMRNMVAKPFEVVHTAQGFATLVEKLRQLDGEVRIVMEHTGRYYESFAMTMHRAGFFVSAVNPLLIKNYQGGINVRKVKTDKADAQKIAQFALDKWTILPHYTPMDTIRYNLKTLHRQFQLASKTKTALSNNLIALLEQSYPGANRYFDSPVRTDGSQKWVDFVDTFWHVDCVAMSSEHAFVERYRKWCKRHGYVFSEQKAIQLHADARQKIPLVPKSDTCKLLVREAVSQLNAVSRTVETYRAEMDRLASQLPEYETVRAMYGVGDTTAAQLIAEIGDIRNFPRRSSLVGFAGVDPAVDDSGKNVGNSKPATKRGSPHLRKTLFQIMTIYLRLAPQDEPVYQFLHKKRSEGKPYYVYMTAGANKFLRIYYARVKECMAKLDAPAENSETAE